MRENMGRREGRISLDGGTAIGGDSPSHLQCAVAVVWQGGLGRLLTRLPASGMLLNQTMVLRPHRAAALRTLGLAPSGTYSQVELKHSFLDHVKRCHPDAGGDATRFREVHAAYTSLRQHASARPTMTSSHAATSHRDDDSAESSAYRGRTPNYSTRHFYRAYTAGDPGHGFTSEEVEAARRRNRLLLVKVMLKHAFLWGGLLYLVWQLTRVDRVGRAAVQRDAGYKDPAYWTLLAKEKTRREESGTTLSAGKPWFEEPLRRRGAHPGPENGNAVGQSSRPMSPAMFRANPYGGRPYVVSFQGRPFTPTGVRGAKAAQPKTDETFIEDQHYEADDDVEDDAEQRAASR